MPPLLIIASGVAAYASIKWYQTVKIKKEARSSAKAEKSKLLFHENHNQSTENLNVPENTINQAVDKHFSIASVSLGLATASSLFYPSLRLASALGVAYNTVPIWQLGYKSLFKDKRFNVIVVDSIAVAGLLLTKHYFLAALLNWLFYSSKKLLLQFKDTFQNSIIHFFVLKDLPNIVWLLKDGVEIEIPLDTLKVGDIVVVNTGGIIPVDGTVTEGIASVDQSILTGDSKPLEKKRGDQVFAFTVVLSGRICIEVEKWGKDTAAAKAAEMYR